MANNYWNNWYFGWGWILWFGMMLLFFSVLGNWGYTYQAHRRYQDLAPGKNAMDALAERYAKGEIQREEFLRMKEEISSAINKSTDGKQTKERPTPSSRFEPVNES